MTQLTDTPLTNTTAVITGAGRGIGRAIALAYARAGATVVAAARSEDEIAETVWLIHELGGQGHAIRVDVRDAEQVDHLVAQTMQVAGAPHTLVNSAGVAVKATLQETSEDLWDSVHGTLLRGTYLVTRAFLQPMIDQGGGNIINISAPIDKLALPGFAAYCSAKYGIDGLTRTLAKEFRRHRINVNALHPGTFADTHLARQLSPDAAKKAVAPDSVAEAAIFLATRPPRDMTGEIINTHTWSYAA